MKKKWIVVIGGVLMALAMTACGSDEDKKSQENTSSSSAENVMMEAEATQIAMDDAGILEEDVKSTEVSLDTGKKTPYYKIVIKVEGKKYRYVINAEEGNIKSVGRSISLF